MKPFLLIVVCCFFHGRCYSQTADDLIRSGYAKAKPNDHYGAIADYTRAIELKPDDAELYYWSGYTKMSLGDREGGCADLKKAAKLGSGEALEYLQMKDNCP